MVYIAPDHRKEKIENTLVMISYFPTLLIDAFGCKQVLTLKFRNL